MLIYFRYMSNSKSTEDGVGMIASAALEGGKVCLGLVAAWCQMAHRLMDAIDQGLLVCRQGRIANRGGA